MSDGRTSHKAAAIQARWEADNAALSRIILMLRTVCGHALEWRGCFPEEIQEEFDAALRSDWPWLERRIGAEEPRA